MDTKQKAVGITPLGDRIQIQFSYKGVRLRPTLNLPPTQANLKHAARVRADVMRDIANNTLNLHRYFPDYRFISHHQSETVAVGFKQVLVLFLAWAGTRQAHSSVLSLQRKLTSFWLPYLGDHDVRDITYKRLSAIVTSHKWGTPKTHNNYVSALREMFTYALDHEYISENVTTRLKMLPVQIDEPRPYSVGEAVRLIAQARKTFGELDELYWHFSFLEGLRPGEQISLQWLDWNKITSRLTISRMRTESADKDRTKTNRARHIDLSAAAVQVLNRLRPLTELRSPFMFIDSKTGEQIQRSHIMQDRWVTLHKLTGIDYRPPYQCRHSSVSWKLMMGQNFMKVAKNHGHSLATMLKTYAHWVDSDSDASELERMKQFHGATLTQLKVV